MATTVRTSVQKAGYYSILADETKDTSKQEQLSIVIRYVDSITHLIVERFLTFVIASDLNAEHLSKYIIDTLTLYNLDIGMIVSQGYDGASVMSGCCSGVQQRIRELVPQAIYIHCHAHCLNLVLVDCVKKTLTPSNSLPQCNLSTSLCHPPKLTPFSLKSKISFIPISKPGNCKGCLILGGHVDTCH